MVSFFIVLKIHKISLEEFKVALVIRKVMKCKEYSEIDCQRYYFDSLAKV